MKKLDNFSNCLEVLKSADIPAFVVLEKTLRDKLQEVETDWN